MNVYVVGGLAISVEGPRAILGAVQKRFAPFCQERPAADVTLRIEAGGEFLADYKLDEPEAGLRIEAGRLGSRITLGGSARGWFDVDRSTGTVLGAVHLGQVDALMRLSLSLVLPRRGALLLHGAAVPMPEHLSSVNASVESDAVVVLLGASGAGKSTLAAALGGTMGDELVVVRPASANEPNLAAVEASGTPYWRGRPDRADVSLLACLHRRQTPATRKVSGSAALRELMSHVVRYVPEETTDRAIFALLGAVCSQVPVLRLACPEGPALVPFVRQALAQDALQ